ncbi:hypothetical protein [Streptomyces sp. WMMC500]|uniref:hypothetical protein n=1 Tax=Streptomyces sp. WMMC500 TaxID=3015154 RepID=UPI0032B2DB15
MHLNPRSGHWPPDQSRLRHHVGLVCARRPRLAPPASPVGTPTRSVPPGFLDRRGRPGPLGGRVRAGQPRRWAPGGPAACDRRGRGSE